jgi:hypothetical protein
MHREGLANGSLATCGTCSHTSSLHTSTTATSRISTAITWGLYLMNRSHLLRCVQAQWADRSRGSLQIAKMIDRGWPSYDFPAPLVDRPCRITRVSEMAG